MARKQFSKRLVPSLSPSIVQVKSKRWVTLTLRKVSKICCSAWERTANSILTSLKSSMQTWITWFAPITYKGVRTISHWKVEARCSHNSKCNSSSNLAEWWLARASLLRWELVWNLLCKLCSPVWVEWACSNNPEWCQECKEDILVWLASRLTVCSSSDLVRTLLDSSWVLECKEAWDGALRHNKTWWTRTPPNNLCKAIIRDSTVSHIISRDAEY